MQVSSLNLKRQYGSLFPKLRETFARVLDSGHFVLGPEVDAFEKEVAEYLGARHAIGVSNGTDALWLCLKALNIGAGDRVLTSPFTFFATVSATVNAGATPVFADIESNTFNLDPAEVEEILKKDTERKIKAIVPVHLYGQPANMTRLASIADKFGVGVIEDAAQSIGAAIKNRLAGNFGHLASFSCFPTKNLGAIGEAGFVTTNDSALAEKVRLLRVHGMPQRYHHDIIGSNCRIDALQAALLRDFLPQLEVWHQQREEIAATYTKALSRCRGIVPPFLNPDSRHAFHQYTIRVTGGKRDTLKEHLEARGIQSMIYYPIPCHLQKAVSQLGYKPGDFPKSELAAQEVLSLPIFPSLKMDEMEAVIGALLEWDEKHF